jgi:hypothetical protein
MGRMKKNANHPTEPVTVPRGLDHIVAGVSTSDGDGVKLTRVLQQPLQKRLDPYLMLDAFGSDNPGDYIGGFPNHPHRGFETVTYMIAGRMRHRDSAGHEGLLENGGVQWMTAGRGLVHSELPEQEEGLMEGFQLWLNLPAKDKMREPWYRDIQSEEIPEYTTADGRARARDRGREPRHRRRGAARAHRAAGTWTSRCRRAPSSRSRCRGPQRAGLRVPRVALDRGQRSADAPHGHPRQRRRQRRRGAARRPSRRRSSGSRRSPGTPTSKAARRRSPRRPGPATPIPTTTCRWNGRVPASA